MKQPLVLDPVRVYMVPNRISIQVWEEHSNDGGLLFDRCRIVQYAESVDAQVIDQARTWVGAIVKQQRQAMKNPQRQAR
jgi:hypothetical protein